MVWIPFNRAAMCTDCDTIFHISDHKECPACTSVVWVPLGSIIQACGEDAEKEAAESYKLREVTKKFPAFPGEHIKKGDKLTIQISRDWAAGLIIKDVNGEYIAAEELTTPEVCVDPYTKMIYNMKYENNDCNPPNQLEINP